MTDQSLRSRRPAARLGLMAAATALLVGSVAACSATEDTSKGSPAGAAGGSGGGGAGANPATGSPIKIGFASPETGAVSFPGGRKGAEAAEEYINKDLGGINGHRLQLEFCDVQNSVQATQACGQKFASDKSMPFALATLNVFGNAGLDAAMKAAGKPVLGGVGITPSDLSDPNAYWVYAGNPAAYGAIGDVVKAEAAKGGVDHLSVIHNDGDQSTINGLKTVQQHLAGSTQMIKAAVAPNAADYLSSISAAKVTNNSVLELAILNPTACLAAAKDLDKLGIHPKLVLAAATCVTQDMAAANPKLFEGWYFDVAVQNVFSEKADNPPSVKEYIAAWKKYGSGTLPSDADMGFGVTMSMYKILKAEKVTKVTPDSVTAAIKAYKGPVPLSSGSLDCPGPAPTPSMCNAGVSWYQAHDGVLGLTDAPAE